MAIGNILQSKNSLAVSIVLWKNKAKQNAVLVIAHGILILACKETKEKLIEPFNVSTGIQSIILAHD